MGGFFLAFSFCELLSLPGCVDCFQACDAAACPVRAYGCAHPPIELGLGVACPIGFAPVAANLITLVGVVGVSQALFQERRIRRARLGTVFNLPMSKVTFIKDGVMAALAAGRLWRLFVKGNGSDSCTTPSRSS